MSDSEDLNCGSGGGDDRFFGLRVASIFIIGVGSISGALFPVLARRSSWLRVPKSLFDFAKYFGSGVIIATAFIHLLSPALEALGSPCLAEGWQDYPYALALCLLSIFSLFITEFLAFRWGTAKLAQIGAKHDAHGHNVGSHVNHGPEGGMRTTHDHEEGERITPRKTKESDSVRDAELGIVHSGGSTPSSLDSAWVQVIGIAILEFGVVLHSVLIGLTLAVDEDFRVLFVVLVFHQTFEGLGIGSRLAFLEFPGHPQYQKWFPILGALLYGITTPVGIAAGLGVRSTYNPGSTTASIVSGVMDSLSAGILIYTGLVELLAHEFLFNKEMMNASNGKLAYAIGSMLLGCGIMALLGRWA
ncbi:ZIP-like iron-zinc transporter [Dendrothele bispora CBS 962.96]|uniref:ZIP-like iron-zinc transporter n=2 Tax=Dendrothele bispora (strain CBS 962.96) TaxID=1314807 RepID=A0A4S8LAR7_DENBC|nr:ZIP-like iron-zinc transporter [Dendrothele bispora CBS 962.96]